MCSFVENILKFILNKHSKKDAECVCRKNFTSAASFEFSAQKQKQKNKVEEDMQLIIKKYGNSPSALLNYIEQKGTKVYKIPHARKLLALIKYDEGFMAQTSGLKALYLNLITSFYCKSINISLATEPMIIIDKNHINQYSTTQYFYKWYSMKMNLPGFEVKTQENFQKFLLPNNDAEIKNLTIDEILDLQEAISRDLDSINFVIKMAKNTSGSKFAMQKLKTGGASV